MWFYCAQDDRWKTIASDITLSHNLECRLIAIRESLSGGNCVQSSRLAQTPLSGVSDS